jgi:hypothetical protein
MSNFDTMPWQLRLEEIFTAPLLPADVETRDPFTRDDDVVLHSEEQNSGVRVRSYATDGHDYRQELTIAAGQAVGQILQGNDREHSQGQHITFADVITKVASVMHIQSDKDHFLWNFTPFNGRMNPTFSMPPGLSFVEDAFQFAISSVPGGSTLTSTSAVTSALNLAGASGFADFTTPFNTYCTMTAQKIPQWNFAAIAFMQLLFKGGTDLWLCGPPGSPLVPSPKLLTLLPLIKQNYTTAFTGSVQGKAIGNTIKDLLKSVVPGMNLLPS